MPTSISFAAFFHSSYCPALTLQRCLTHICTSIGVSEISISHFIFSFFPPSCSSSCFCLSFFAFLLYSLPSHHSSRINIWAQLFCLCQALRAGQHIEATKFILSIPLLYVSLHRENFKTISVLRWKCIPTLLLVERNNRFTVNHSRWTFPTDKTTMLHSHSRKGQSEHLQYLQEGALGAEQLTFPDHWLSLAPRMMQRCSSTCASSRLSGKFYTARQGVHFTMFVNSLLYWRPQATWYIHISLMILNMSVSIIEVL